MRDDRTVPAVLSAIAPAIVGVVGLAIFFVLANGPSELLQLVAMGGVFAWGTMAIGALGTVAIPVLAFLISRGREVPAAVPAFVALLPWGVGLIGTVAGMSMVEGALAAVDPAQAGLLYAVGTGESFVNRALGSYGSALLLFGLALSLIIAAISDDVRRARLWSAAGVTGAAALIAGATAIAVLSISKGLTGAGMGSPADRAVILAVSFSTAAYARTAQLGAGALLALAVAVHVLVSALRGGGTKVIGAIVLGLIALVGPGLDLLVDQQARDRISRLTLAPWSKVEGFEPLQVSGEERAGEIHGYVTTAELRLFGEAPRSPNDPALPQLLAKAADSAKGSAGLAFAGEVRRDRVLRLGFDRRASAAVVKQIVDAAAKGEVHAIVLVGENGRVPEELARALGRDAAFLKLLLEGVSSVEVLTPAAMTADDHARDPNLLHAEVSGGETLEVKARAGAEIEPFTVDLEGPRPSAVEPEGVVVRLMMGDSATASELARAADRLADLELRPMLLMEMPELSARPKPEEVTGTGRGLLGAIGARDTEPATGRLARKAIKRVIKKNLGRIKYCYERRLAQAPELKGKVVVGFMIAPSGRVKSASIAETTLSDAGVERCVLRAVERMRFPKPKGGSVRVRYPFVFKSAR